MSELTPLQTAVFEDCDAYFEAINDVNVRFTLRGLETSKWRISGFALPCGINIQHCCSGSGSIAQGVSRDGGFELAIPATGRYTANGKPVPIESVLFMVPGSEFLVSIPKSHSWFGVFVPEALAQAIGLSERARGQTRKRTQVLGNAAPASGSVPSLLGRFVASAIAAPEMLGRERSLRRFEDELLLRLGSAYGYFPESRRNHPGRPPVVDHIAVNRALDLIESAPEPTIGMAELVQTANVSERSLRGGFRKYLGMSPTRYMQLCTLNRARRRLANSRPEEASVAEVVTDLGVWDLGRFAARYRQMFGELPSSTLRRSG